jgi:hypothetical protein
MAIAGAAAEAAGLAAMEGQAATLAIKANDATARSLAVQERLIIAVT